MLMSSSCFCSASVDMGSGALEINTAVLDIHHVDSLESILANSPMDQSIYVETSSNWSPDTKPNDDFLDEEENATTQVVVSSTERK